jgi:hypothetical protein
MAERETPITRACNAWREVLPVHPACKIIPPYTESKLLELGRDIKASGGIKIPVIVLVPPGGKLALVDGRSRLDALCHVGIKFEIKVSDDGHVVIDALGYDIPAPIEIIPDENFNIYAFALSTNLHRRHLKNNDKREITKKLIEAQPTLSDRAIAKMAGIDHKTVKAIRLNANGEIPHTDRVEASGRIARGRRPKIAEPVDVTPTPPPVVNKPTVVPIAAVPIKPKPTASNGFDAAEALAQADKALAMFNRQISAPNWDAARKEVFHLRDLLLRHKTLRAAA